MDRPSRPASRVDAWLFDMEKGLTNSAERLAKVPERACVIRYAGILITSTWSRTLSAASTAHGSKPYDSRPLGRVCGPGGVGRNMPPRIFLTKCMPTRFVQSCVRATRENLVRGAPVATSLGDCLRGCRRCAWLGGQRAIQSGGRKPTAPFTNSLPRAK